MKSKTKINPDPIKTLEKKAKQEPYKKTTDWSTVSEMYDKYLGKDSSYHKELVLPNLLRLIGDASKQNVLDVACGQGFFAEAIKNKFNNSNVLAFDLASPLIDIAKKNNPAPVGAGQIKYFVADAESFAGDIEEIANGSYKADLVICILALQNIENIKKVLDNIKKVINKNGRCVFVINHPSFRIPKFSSWGYENDVQYRRVEKYIIEDKIKLDMTPSEKREIYKRYTYSFHRPLQYYFKLFKNTGFVVTNLEEWISNKESVGKNASRENCARKEIPIFMALEIKLG